MDPITLIVAALTAGAVSGVTDAASSAVKDAYTGLRDLVKKRLGGEDSAGEIVLKHHEASPETWKAPLAEILKEKKVDNDPDLLRAAQELMSLLDSEGTASNKYKVDLRGAKGVQVGDFNSQTNKW
ncbi:MULTISPECIES: hypothetical protein [unclassified Nocardiopsis]|uniref:hypothetical protein n=1 Tax=Nocardiopsis TaxID=2013 RepID=UPI00387B54DE